MWTLLKNKIKLHLQTGHPYYLVDPSPWPIFASSGGFCLTIGGVLYMRRSPQHLAAIHSVLRLQLKFFSAGSSDNNQSSANSSESRASIIERNRRLRPEIVNSYFVAQNRGSYISPGKLSQVYGVRRHTITLWVSNHPDYVRPKTNYKIRQTHVLFIHRLFFVESHQYSLQEVTRQLNTHFNVSFSLNTIRKIKQSLETRGLTLVLEDYYTH